MAQAGQSSDHVRLGRTDLFVSRVCQGTAFRHIGRLADNPRGEAVIHHCLDRGLNFFDTAMKYEFGQAELALGKALAGRRDQAVICTKVEPRYLPDRPGGPRREATYTRSFLQQQIEGSLQRLGTDHVDLYLMHEPDQVTPAADIAESMAGLVQSGKSRYWGASNHSPNLVAEYIKLAETSGGGGIAAIEDYYNIAGDENAAAGQTESRMVNLERAMFPLVRQSGIGVVAFSPMDTGSLIGKQPLRPDSPIIALTAVLDEVAAELNVTRASVCVAWVFSHREVTSVLSGAESAQHVDQTLIGAQLQLPHDALRKLNEANRKYRAEWASIRRNERRGSQ